MIKLFSKDPSIRIEEHFSQKRNFQNLNNAGKQFYEALKNEAHKKAYYVVIMMKGMSQEEIKNSKSYNFMIVDEKNVPHMYIELTIQSNSSAVTKIKKELMKLSGITYYQAKVAKEYNFTEMLSLL